MATYRHTFTVTGDGRFPLDMLRYESCYPASTPDVGSLDDGEREERSIVLHTVTGNANWAPARNRWESFGWNVTAVSKGLRI